MAGRIFDLFADGHVHDHFATAEAMQCANKATFALMLSNWKKNGILVYNRRTLTYRLCVFHTAAPALLRVESLEYEGSLLAHTTFSMNGMIATFVIGAKKRTQGKDASIDLL